MSLAGTVASSVLKGEDLAWTPGNGGDNASVYQEANWTDPITGQTAPADAVNPVTPLDRSLRIWTGNSGGGGGAGADLFLGTGELEIRNATLRMSASNEAGINMGANHRAIKITDGNLLTQRVVNGQIELAGRSELTFYGPDPLDNSIVDLQSSDSFVYFLNRLPSAVIGNDLQNFTVNSAPAVDGGNVEVTQYYNGTLVRALPAGNIALRAFDQPDLAGTPWNFSPGFHGNVGLGLSSFEAGTYTISGWGADIWGTSDEFHFVYRELSGDGEIVAKVDSVENSHFWAKAGLMMREDLSDGARNVFIFQRPDGLVTHQHRSTAEGASASSQKVNADWIRLVRIGNVFTSFYSTTGANGPWIEAESETLAMGTSIQVGLAVTSHLGIERGTSVLSEVSISEGGAAVTSGTIGLFDAAIDIDDVWSRNDQISSFLLKKGYAVTFAEDAGGQGFSQFYAATEGDLSINLPAELDDKVTFMRVLPWRWVAKKGWAGANDTFPATIETHWKYEWEPTGFSQNNWEFVPMIRGRGQDRDFRWEEVRVRGGQTHFLGFNEPNIASQGDLTVDEAIALWPKVQQIGLRIGSPAPTDNAAGLAWLEEFMTKADARGYRVDYICLHNYAQRNANGLKNWLDNIHAKYGLPIWLTEFQRDVDTDNPTATDHQDYLEGVVTMLEDLDYLERYAYYNFNTETPSNSNASLFNGDGSVNAKGVFYRDFFSNPAFENTGQPAWASATISGVSSGNMMSLSASSSLDVASVASVEFFANGMSLGTSSTAPFSLEASVPSGLQSVSAVVTTTYGESFATNAVQTFVSDGLLIDLTLAQDGVLRWGAVPGEIYRLESSFTLQNGSWSLLEKRVAIGSFELVTDPNWAVEPKKFYRVLRE